MNHNALGSAYLELIRTATAITDTSSLSEQDRSLVDWTIAHIALSDPVLIAATHQVATGSPAVVDNREAMDTTALDALINSTSHQQRVDLIRRNAADFVAAARDVPDDAANTPVRLSLVDRDGQPVPDQQLPWNELIHLRATQHLPGHTAKLAELTQPI